MDRREYVGEGVLARVENKYSATKKATQVYHTRVMTSRAQAISAMVERWGMVAAVPDGEDAAGRQRLRLMTPAELVERATDTVDLMFGYFDAAGLFVEIPVPELIPEEADAG